MGDELKWLLKEGDGHIFESCSISLEKHVLRHKWVGILSREKHPLQQLHLKKGGGRIFEGGLIFGRLQ